MWLWIVVRFSPRVWESRSRSNKASLMRGKIPDAQALRAAGTLDEQFVFENRSGPDPSTRLPESQSLSVLVPSAPQSRREMIGCEERAPQARSREGWPPARRADLL